MATVERNSAIQSSGALSHQIFTLQDLRMHRMKQLPAYVGISRAAIYNKILDGSFPKPVSLGGKSVGWPEYVIKEYLQTLVLKGAR